MLQALVPGLQSANPLHLCIRCSSAVRGSHPPARTRAPLLPPSLPPVAPALTQFEETGKVTVGYSAQEQHAPLHTPSKMQGPPRLTFSSPQPSVTRLLIVLCSLGHGLAKGQAVHLPLPFLHVHLAGCVETGAAAGGGGGGGWAADERTATATLASISVTCCHCMAGSTAGGEAGRRGAALQSPAAALPRAAVAIGQWSEVHCTRWRCRALQRPSGKLDFAGARCVRLALAGQGLWAIWQ